MLHGHLQPEHTAFSDCLIVSLPGLLDLKQAQRRIKGFPGWDMLAGQNCMHTTAEGDPGHAAS